jgi:hypothetical protein
VTQVLRLVKQARWDVREGHDWLPQGDIPAAPLADFTNTSQHCLSVWFVDSEELVNRVVGALAASREKADVLDYVLFPQNYLKAAEMEVREIPGRTPDENVNRCHRDLIHVSADKVVLLAKRIWHRNPEDILDSKVKRVYTQDVIHLVVKAVRRERISLERLKPKLRAAIRTRLADAGNESIRPK